MENEVYHILNSDNRIIAKDTQNLLIQLSELILNAGENISFYKSELHDISNRNSSLEVSLSEESRKRASMEAKVNDLKNEVENLSGNKSYYIDLVKSLEIKLEESSHYKNDFDILQQKYDKLLLLNENLNAEAIKIPKLNDEINELSKHKEDLINEKLLIESKNSKLEKSLFNFELVQKELANKNIRIYDLMNEIHLLKDRIALEESKVLLAKSQEKSLENLKLELAALYQKYNSESNDLNTKFYNQSIEMVNLTDELNLIKIENGNIENEKLMLQANLDEMNDLNSQLNSNFEILQQNLDLKVAQYESVNLSLLELKSELEKCNNKLGILSSEDKLSKTEITISNSQIQKLQNYNNELMEEIENLENKIKTLQEEKINLDIEYEKLKVQNTQDENALNKLTLQINKDESEIENLRTEIGNSKANIELEFSNRIKELETNNKIFEQAMTENLEVIQNKNKEIEILNIKISEAINKHQANDTIIKEFTNQNTINQLSINNLQKRVIDLEELVKTRYGQIQILESKINDLLEEKSRLVILKSELKGKLEKLISITDKEILELENE